MTKVSEVLAGATVEVGDGDILASITRSEGFAPSYKDTKSFNKGQYLFKIIGKGTPNLGVYPEHHIIPVVINEAGTALEDDATSPIAIQTAGKVVALTGRNNPEFKDGYQDRQYYTVEGITAGQEHRHLLIAFVEFVKSEYSLGVNDFTIEGPEYTAAP